MNLASGEKGLLTVHQIAIVKIELWLYLLQIIENKQLSSMNKQMPLVLVEFISKQININSRVCGAAAAATNIWKTKGLILSIVP